MKIYGAILLILFSCSQIATNDSREKENKNLLAFFEKNFEDNLLRYPEYATYVGNKTNYDKLNDISDEKSLEEIELTKKALKELREFNFKWLTPENQMSYLLFEQMAHEEIDSFKYRFHNYPVNQMFGRHSGLVSFMINTHRIDNLKDANAYIARVSLFKEQMHELCKLLENRAQKGVIPPKFIYPKAIGDAQNIISGYPFTSKNKNALWEDFEGKIKNIKITKKEKSLLESNLKKALLTSVKPGYEELIKKLSYLEKLAPVEGTAFHLPDGKNFYQNQLKEITTTSMDPDEIHHLGLRETRRIHNEIMAIMKLVDFKGELKDFFNYVKTDQRFRYPNTARGKQSFLTDSQKIIDQMKKKLPEMFNVFPKADLIVKAVEPYREKSAGEAFYQGPSEDGKRPGTYYVNLYDMDMVAKHELEALAYHEAIPGHHMQIAIATELENMPRFRKFSRFTAYTEGWGLYAERLPKEFGFYQDPYSDFGRLSMELWRAGRLVVDSGLHSKGWTMDEAVKWLNENTPSTEAENRKAVERYVVMPGQATAYMIGMLKILDLRNIAKEKLLDKFDIKEFHDQVLKSGPLPLSLLEERINDYIDQKK